MKSSLYIDICNSGDSEGTGRRRIQYPEETHVASVCGKVNSDIEQNMV